MPPTTPPAAPTSSASAFAVAVASPSPAGVRSLWRLRRYVWPHRYRWALMLLAALAVVGVSLAIPLVTAAVIDGPIADGEARAIPLLGLLALALGVAEAALIFLRRWVQSGAVLNVETAIRNDLYTRLQALPMRFHARWQSGQLLSRITVDLSTIRRFLGFGLLFLVISVLQLVVTVMLMVHLYWPLGLVVAAFALPVVWLSMRFEKKYVVVSRQVQDEQGDVATLVEESAVGLRVIKSFGRRKHMYDNFDDGARRLYRTSMDKVRLSARFWTLLEVLPNLALVFVLLLGVIAVADGALSPGELVAFIALMLQLIWPVEALGFILAMSQEAMTAAERVHEVFDTQPDIVSGPYRPSSSRGHLRMEEVGFTFPDSDTPVLHGVNLDLTPGETLAVVGATGSGKSALTALVPRLYDVTSGRITIDGVDVRDYDLRCLRQIVATAFADPTLFSMSARENLTLGRPEATDPEIAEAVEIAQASFVYDLPWGLDTRIGEQGMSLSGGQRQRLALARAVLAEPKILVLDDTLSALDVHTEALVERALRRVLREATGIVVAHRASTVLLADRVALLQGGTITHLGTHHELLRDVSAYRELLGQEAGTEPRLAGEEVLR